MSEQLKHIFTNYFEITVFSVGLLLMVFMDPTTGYRSSWCLYEIVGVNFCPGEGLGHSIAYIFRGQFYNAMQANVLGPFAIIVLFSRVGFLLRKNNGINLKKDK